MKKIINIFIFFLSIFILFFLVTVNVYSVEFKSCFINIDNTCSSYINHFTKSRVIDIVMIIITSTGDGFVTSLVVGLILFLHDRTTFKFNFIFFVTVLILGGVLVQILKYLIGSPRPLERLDDVRVITSPLRYNGFPSGHTQTAFAAAAFLGKKFKKLIWFFFFIATLVGLSRIYIGVHFLSDVIGGALIGIFITEIFCRMFKIGSPVFYKP